MGLLESSDWQAQWIGGPLTGGPQTGVPAPFLRKNFVCTSEIASARLYVTALGLYECQINGEVVGDLVLTPGWSSYYDNVPYQVYDVTAQLRTGGNTIGLILGDGWYCGFLGWWGRQQYGLEPKSLAQLEIRYQDGSIARIGTDGSWRVAHGPILQNDILNGESYDARQELIGWSTGIFDDSTWQPARVFADVAVRPYIKKGPPVRRIREFQPVGEPVVAPKGVLPSRVKAFIFDFGQNLTGRIRLKIRAPRDRQIIIRHGETLDADGSLYVANLRSAQATDYYTCRGDGEEIWEPRFTYHGFRYIEVQGLPEPLTPDCVTAIVLHSEITPTGEFQCSDPLLNQLHHNIEWGERGNMLEIPSDCPQRDERLGWTGDAQVFVRTASYIMDVAGFFAKFQDDMADAQFANGNIGKVAPAPPTCRDGEGGPAWSDAAIICPWTIYLCYGDRAILERNYESMQRFLDYLSTTALDHIRCHPDKDDWWCFGDWLALDGSERVGAEPFGRTPSDLIGTAFYAYDAGLMARIARILGRDNDAARYEDLSAKVRQAFQQRFINPDGSMTADTQTSYVLALHFDLAQREHRAGMAEWIVADIRRRGHKLATGFVGTPYLLHVLTEAGHTDAAYDVLFQKDWPSWLYAVTHGATTIWERWDGWTEDRGFQNVWMNSFNHYAYGAVGDWMYRKIGGLDFEETAPAYKRALIRPLPGGGITHASARIETMHGLLACAWKIEGDELMVDVTLPSNTSAALDVPPPYEQKSLALQSGQHSFRFRRV